MNKLDQSPHKKVGERGQKEYHGSDTKPGRQESSPTSQQTERPLGQHVELQLINMGFNELLTSESIDTLRLGPYKLDHQLRSDGFKNQDSTENP